MTWVWAKDNPEIVPGARRVEGPGSLVWAKMFGDIECLAVSGGYLWRAMVVGPPPPDGTTLYITHHQFESPTEALADAERWMQLHCP